MTWLILIMAVLIIAVDQVSKHLVSTYLPPGGVWSPFSGSPPVFQIAHTYNTGVAFGLFKDLGPVLIIVSLVVSGAIVVYARRWHADQRLAGVALSLLLGGTIGNVIDRIRLGHVIDFFDVGIGTLRNASNLADWSIVSGVMLLAITMLREERRRQPTLAATDLETKRTA